MYTSVVWMAKMGTLVTLCSSAFVLILAASVGPPKFVVPNHPDLTIKTRRTSGNWMLQLDSLYLKGARQRTETVVEKPTREAANWAVIRQCDEKRLFNLNQRDKIYASSRIEDWSERLRKARPVALARS